MRLHALAIATLGCLTACSPPTEKIGESSTSSGPMATTSSEGEGSTTNDDGAPVDTTDATEDGATTSSDGEVTSAADASATDSSATESSATDSTGAPSEVDALCEAYCAMEETCIPTCDGGCGGAACAAGCPQWLGNHFASSEACADTLAAWTECIVAATCEDVAEFFMAQPDGVTAATPCGAEYEALQCDDFEPRTEYGGW